MGEVGLQGVGRPGVDGCVRPAEPELPGTRAVGGHVEPVAAAAQLEAGHLAGAVGARDHQGALGAVGEGVHPQFDTVPPGRDRVLVVGAERDDGVGAGQQRQGVEAVLFADQAGTVDPGTGQNVGPRSGT
ncbi:hypothetical protein [Streptomyces sp. NBC_00069]|uniref:hypothetical protein n=1 Tax=Streptomyces sp. NBC_00069 TaxID=2975639 RepID=UPI00225AD64A|nr:hypothetical protein OG513_00765 [Streptomyces sp. NBC_00998]